MSATARVSDAALAYAATLHTLDAARLAQRLYEYGRYPCTDAWLDVVAAHGGIRGFLDLAQSGGEGRALGRPWSVRTEAAMTTGWIAWERAPARAAGDRRGERATYKLYVAPVPLRTPDALRAALPVLVRTRAFAFKVAARVDAILRPDKLVAYFDTRAALDDAADALVPALAGLPAHPVPFTAALEDGGLLSWGMDPPCVTSGDDAPTSWRSWITTRLAAYLAHDRGAPAAPSLARERLARDGVDVENWAPRSPRWHGAVTSLA